MRAGEPGRGVFQPDRRRFVRRDARLEQEARARLVHLGVRERAPHVAATTGTSLDLSPRQLAARGEHAARRGMARRGRGPALSPRGGAIQIEVGSGVDWFELHGRGRVRRRDGHPARAAGRPAARREHGASRRRHVRPAPGGVAPALRRRWPGSARRTGVTFASRAPGRVCSTRCSPPSPRSACDETFARAREELRRFEGIRPAEPPRLRRRAAPLPARRPRLAPLPRALRLRRLPRRRHGSGQDGQVLALLEARRVAPGPAPARAGPPGPSLVVVPRSLVFNWKQEAARFTPKLRVLDHTGAARLAPGAHFADHDLVLTTYGTLRRDAAAFAETRFDYVILDEAQAIKNAGTDRPRRRGCFRADHRLALSGTPVENHLGELWSLFEFLNPGMLGGRRRSRPRARRCATPTSRTRRLLARGAPAVRPPAHQGAGGAGAAAEGRADALLRARAHAARALRRAARPLPRRRCWAARARGPRPGEDPRPRGAAAPAPGGVPSRPDRSASAPGRRAPSSTRSCRSSPRCSTEGHKALVFSQFTEPARPSCATGSTRGDRLRVPRRPHRGTGHARVDRFQADAALPCSSSASRRGASAST